MRWVDARVVIVDVLCTPAPQDRLVVDVTAALRAFEGEGRLELGRWTTSGIRLRRPRDDEERDWLFESLFQPDDPSAEAREAMVLEIGGRGSQRNADRAAEVVRRALCPDEFHPGACPIQWGTMGTALRQETRDGRLFYRDLFAPRGR